MPLTVFYSWQSDIAASINRNFVEDALKKAINKLGSDVEVQEAIRDEVIEFDKDTQGVPGIPPIFQVILNKISRCSIFVPDLTFVGRTPDGRQIPNPNVLIEYGWALKEVGHGRMIPVMNAAFGSPSAEALPFDMKHLRFPITYSLSEAASDDARKREKQRLTEQLSAAIALILKNSDQNRQEGNSGDFEEIKPATDPAVFVTDRGPIAELPEHNRSDKPLSIPDGAKLFLRLIPTRKLEALRTSKTALDLVKAGPLQAMGDSGFSGRYLRNRYGAVVASVGNERLNALTQLFTNRELWGIDTWTINRQHQMNHVNVDFGFFPCVRLEECFVSTLANYLMFSRQTTKLAMPLKFIAGATGVVGYRMTAPSNMHFGGFAQFDGKAIETNIVYTGLIRSYDEGPIAILRPFFEYVWEECGLTRPDRDLLQ